MENNKNSVSLALVAAAIVTIGLIYFADLLTPLALAIFLWLIIDAFAKKIHEKFPIISRKLAVPVTLLISFLILGSMLAFVADYAQAFAKDISSYKGKLEDTISQVYHAFPMLGQPPTLGQIFDNVDPAEILNKAGAVLKGFGSQAIFVLLYVMSLFVAQASLPKKIVAIFPDREKREKVMEVTTAIRRSMEAYLWVQTSTGALIAVSCWIIFLVLGLKNALFWALITFLLSYIPALGGIIASVFPALFALIQFPTIWPAIIILGATHAVQSFVGNIVQPRMNGDSLNISIIMVFISLAFWGKIWGGAGMFLSVPITVMIMIIMSQFPSTRPISIMMSANGNPDIDTKPHKSKLNNKKAENNKK